MIGLHCQQRSPLVELAPSTGWRSSNHEERERERFECVGPTNNTFQYYICFPRNTTESLVISSPTLDIDFKQRGQSNSFIVDVDVLEREVTNPLMSFNTSQLGSSLVRNFSHILNLESIAIAMDHFRPIKVLPIHELARVSISWVLII